MADTPMPWDAVFGRVRVPRESGNVYAPPLTEADFDTVDLGAPLPASYRAFGLRFGLGGRFGDSLRLLLLDESPETAQRGGRIGTVVGDTAFLRSRDQMAGLEVRLGRCICFACEGNEVRKTKRVYLWATSQITDRKAPEYAVFQLRVLYIPGVETNSIRSWVRVAENFHEFVEWTQDRWPGEAPEEEERPILYSPWVVRRRGKPGNRDVKRWLAFNNNTVRDLALAIRDHGRTDAFPVLADALEEAGCTNADVLDSCRRGDPDIDGLWMLRVLLGK